MGKVFCYELNEVPWRVVDLYVERRPKGVLARLLERSDQLTTHTVDSGELHPWSTWPTLHRGVSNDTHGIRFLNQDLDGASAWPPVWELLNAAGVTTGICGSLQSYPPVHDRHMLFHVPDTFAAGSETVPPRYEPFQAFNLRQTGSNKAVASRVRAHEIGGAVGLVRSGIRLRTFAGIGRHLLAERVQPLYTRRRPLLQPELALDVLVHLLRHHAQPDFVTFFSNHVAGIMHRYWKYSFPEDFGYELRDDATDRFHADSLIVAMEQAERHLERLLPLCERYGYEIVVCSSMGQEAIDRGEYVPELRIVDLDRLLAALPGRYDVTMNLAMHPDVAFSFPGTAELEAFRRDVAEVRDSAGRSLFLARYEPVGVTLNVASVVSETLAADREVHLGGTVRSLDELGLEVFERDIGTGYHQPEGILLWHHDRARRRQDRARIDTRSIAPTLLEFFGVEPPPYMHRPIARIGGTSAEVATEALAEPA